VSTYAGQLESVAQARGETILERRLPRQIIGVAGVFAGIGGGAFVATSGHLVRASRPAGSPAKRLLAAP
jgi:hypothetical protein